MRKARKTLNISTPVSLRKTRIKDNLGLIPAHSPPAVRSIKFNGRTVALLRRMGLRNSRARYSLLTRITVVKHRALHRNHLTRQAVFRSIRHKGHIHQHRIISRRVKISSRQIPHTLVKEYSLQPSKTITNKDHIPRRIVMITSIKLNMSSGWDLGARALNRAHTSQISLVSAHTVGPTSLSRWLQNHSYCNIEIHELTVTQADIMSTLRRVEIGRRS
jgi:hypothetical protein